MGKRAIFFNNIFFLFYTLHMSHSVQPGREWLVVCGKLPSLVVHTHKLYTSISPIFLKLYFCKYLVYLPVQKVSDLQAEVE